jgi:hypothetical protein
LCCYVLVAIVLVLVTGVTASGCGGDDESTSDTTAEPAYDTGCTKDEPNRLSTEDAAYDGLATLCSSDDQIRLRISNVSEANVLFTEHASGPSLEWNYVGIQPGSFAEAKAKEAVQAGCGTYCVLYPGDAVVAIGPADSIVNVGVYTAATVKANYTRGLWAFIEAKVTSPQALLRKQAVACLNGAAKQLENVSDPEFQILQGLQNFFQCKPIWEALSNDPRPEVTATGEIRAAARSFGGGLWRDLLRVATIKVIR